ncbi:site-specific tyrosine recombinase XerD [Nigerium massiliense]|uniref:site-specific tyrosine recombinase XerD n=1 Tax=Nigerium massiliense TaxID=1522317 RepID=UPI00058ECDE6|nr:site-specific tyrosine recombinase XerD [Nigerium massiliense]
MGDVSDAVVGFLDHLEVEAGASPHTIGGYRRDLARYAGFLADQGIGQVEEVRPEHVSGFVRFLGEPAGDRAALAASSIARATVAVRSFHTFVAIDRQTGTNPAAAVAPPKQAARLPKALPLDQVQALLDAPDRDTPAGLRDAALLELLYGTGARISELTALDVDDISAQLDDPELGLRLFGKGRKERIVPLGSFARKAVGDYLVRARPVLIGKASRPGPALLLNARGGRLSRQSAFNAVHGAAEKANLDLDIGPHTLRHSFATHLLDGGADVRVVQELLGHASVTTTQIYTKITAEHLREVFLTAHPRAR